MQRVCMRVGCDVPLTPRQRSYCSQRCSALKGRCPRNGHTPEWPPERCAVLMDLWNKGLSASAIGLRLGMSKSSIIGKARRLGLSARPSPIRPNPEARKRADRPKRLPNGLLPQTLPTLAPLASLSRPTRHTPPIVPPKTERPIRVPQARPERPHEPKRQCAFLRGDKPNWRQCEAVAQSGSPYCPEHHRLCYVRICDRREDDVLALVAA